MPAVLFAGYAELAVSSPEVAETITRTGSPKVTHQFQY